MWSVRTDCSEVRTDVNAALSEAEWPQWRCERVAGSASAQPQEQVCTHHYGRAEGVHGELQMEHCNFVSFVPSESDPPSICHALSFLFIYVGNVLAVLWSLVIQGNLRICNAMVRCHQVVFDKEI